MQRHLGHSGFSLIEIVIASVILAIIVGSTLTFMSNTETQDSFRGKIQQDSTCLAEANRVITNIKERGQSRVRLNFPRSKIVGGSYVFTGPTDPAIGAQGSPDINAGVDTNGDGNFTNDNDYSPAEPGIIFANRWATPIYAATPPNAFAPAVPGPFVVRPHLMIMGYMTALQTMYNSNPSGFCGGSGLQTYGDNTIILQPTTTFNQRQGAAAPITRLRIQPFNTQSGAVTACTAVNVRPAGPRESTLNARTSTATSASPTASPYYPPITNATGIYIFEPDSTTQVDVGFLVTATVDYVDRKGASRSCFVQEKFQYNGQPENSETLEIQDTDQTADATNSTGWTTGAAINDTNNSTKLDINGTIRSLGIANPPALNDGATSNTMYVGCGDVASQHSRSINFRLTRTRPGSVHMCRDLSSLRLAQETTGHGDGGYDYALIHQLRSSNGSNYTATPFMNGFMVRFSTGMFTTFHSHELMRLPYFRGKGEGTGTPYNNLLIGGLYYPQTYSHANIHPSHPVQSSFGQIGDPDFEGAGYYCFSGAGCAGSGTAADMVRRALPRSTHANGSWNVKNASTRYFQAPFNYANSLINWVPCENLTISRCTGTTVAVSQFTPGNNSSSQRDAYHIRLNNLPSGCDVHVQIAEIDAGYNVKATEVREYIQEPQLGNRLCRKGYAGGQFGAIGNDFRGKWFFACTYGPNAYGPASAAPGCTDGNQDQDCCIPFPDFPEYRPVSTP